jgi:hypothetical protein
MIGEEDKKSKRTRPEFDHFYDKSHLSCPLALFLQSHSLLSYLQCYSKNNKEIFTKKPYHPYHDSFNKEAVFKLKIDGVSFYHDTKDFSLKLETKSDKAKNSSKTSQKS